jgi:hypothetical protein
VAISSPKKDLNSEALILSKPWMFVMFRNELNGLWDFYHGTNMGAGSPKAIVMS